MISSLHTLVRADFNLGPPLIVLRRFSGSPYESTNQRHQKQNQENEEQNSRYSGSRYRNPKKAKHGRNQGHHKKRQRPTQHKSSL
jgi:hypothetical protein